MSSTHWSSTPGEWWIYPLPKIPPMDGIPYSIKGRTGNRRKPFYSKMHHIHHPNFKLGIKSSFRISTLLVMTQQTMELMNRGRKKTIYSFFSTKTTMEWSYRSFPTWTAPWFYEADKHMTTERWSGVLRGGFQLPWTIKLSIRDGGDCVGLYRTRTWKSIPPFSASFNIFYYSYLRDIIEVERDLRRSLT